MVDEFKAGTTATKLADAYKLSQQRVMEIIVNRLGMEAFWRIVRTHKHNE